MRKFKIIMAIVLGVLLVGTIILYFSLDAIARYALKNEGSSLMGVSTTASAVDLGVFRHATTISDLVIDNPEGFKRPHLLQVDEMYIEGRLGTFASTDIQIPVIRLTGFNIDLEQIGDRINVTEVVDHISKDVSSDDDTGGDVTLNIALLEIHDIQLTAEGKIVDVTGGKLSAKLPAIQLTDVGTESDPDKLLGHVVAIMMKVVLKHISDNPISGLSNLAVSQISDSIEKIPGLGQAGLGRPIADAVRGIGGVLNNLGHSIEGVGSSHKASQDTPKEDKAQPKEGSQKAPQGSKD